MSTTIITLSPLVAKSLVWLVAMLLIDYVSVIVAVIIDLRSGTLRARREGRPRTSRGYRNTVDKLSRYLVTLLALSAVDAMIVVAAMLFRSTMNWEVPVFPLFTTLGAFAFSLIEGKSVLENLQRKSDITNLAGSVADFFIEKNIQRLGKMVGRHKSEKVD